MELRKFGGLGLARIDDDYGAVRIARHLAQLQAGAREAVRLPRVLADQHQYLGMFDVAVRAAAEHAGLHPGFAGFFLRKRVGTVANAERFQRALGVGAG